MWSGTIPTIFRRSDDQTLKSWVDSHNEQIVDGLPLIKELRPSLRSEGSEPDQFSWVVAVEGKTLTMDATVHSEEKTVSLAVNLQAPEAQSLLLLSGVMEQDGSSGSWMIRPANGPDSIPGGDIHWMGGAAGFQMTRNDWWNQRKVTYARSGTGVVVTFEREGFNGSASWDLTERGGGFEIQGQPRLCWQYTQHSFCDSDCAD